MKFSLRNRPNFTIDSYLELIVFVLYSFNLSSISPIAIYHNITSFDSLQAAARLLCPLYTWMTV